ncbi:hypothetical protein CCACVL1_26926 [Corchorus capsularis]|uniref:Uncharacterized protein n=1 Tax=Corchorus capsularis TaxID=210143 RepID=A0A1R3GCX3_COCAP|nr:hypothetical protein CCACVL1_26926 [Corchorus capsularis]
MSKAYRFSFLQFSGHLQKPHADVLSSNPKLFVT